MKVHFFVRLIRWEVIRCENDVLLGILQDSRVGKRTLLSFEAQESQSFVANGV
ncbi:hypothetical protein SF83666_a43460 (plasmid) [Sinorhizobium fredii CCBAU 83666]|nr:hypothetical protein SF83666_a43460 [Sinorhizobium fredii CCBAU 83666]